MSDKFTFEANGDAVKYFGKCLTCEFAYLTLGEDDLGERCVRLSCDHVDMDSTPTVEDVQKCTYNK